MKCFASLLLLAVLFAAGCQSAGPAPQSNTPEPSKAYTLEACMPDLSRIPMPQHGTGTVEVFWPNGNLRYSASFENDPAGSTRVIECFTPDGQIIYSAAHESSSKPAGSRVNDIAQLRAGIAQHGTHHEHEIYLLDRQGRRAELVIDPEFASIPNANFIADSINGVMMLADDDYVAEIVDRSTIRVWLPETARKTPNADFSFLTQVLNTGIDRELLEMNRHTDRPSPWPTEEDKPLAAEAQQAHNVLLNTVVKSTHWGIQPARENGEPVAGKYVCSANIILLPAYGREHGAQHIADQISAHFKGIKNNPPRISATSRDTIHIWFPYQDHDQVSPNEPLLHAILAMHIQTPPNELTLASDE